HREHCRVLEIFLQVRRVKMSKIDAEDERGRSKGPQAHFSLALVWSEPIVAAIPYLDGVIVVETSGTGVRLPFSHIGETIHNACPRGERIAGSTLLIAVIALDVGCEFPLIRVLHQSWGERCRVTPLRYIQDHRPAALPYRIRPCLHVRGIAVFHAVDFDVIDAP